MGQGGEEGEMGSGWMKDVRYAWRGLRMAPGFTLVAVLTLALGIGANTAIFSVIHAVLLKPLPFPHQEQLVELWETEITPGKYPLADQDFLDWKAQNRSFQDMALYGYRTPSNASREGRAEQIVVVMTEANFFDILGVRPELGRTFAPGEDVKGKNQIAVLSHAFWQERFGGRADAIGAQMVMDGDTYTVIGVMPAWFTAPGTSDLWVPRDMSPDKVSGRGAHYLRALGRLKEGVTAVQAQADLAAIAAALTKQFPKSNTGETAIVVPLHTDLVGDSGKALWIAFGAVGLVLLIACANFANLLLARSLARRREMALRGAIGASRWMLVRQLLTESLMLAVAGGIAGAFLGVGGLELLKSLKGIEVTAPNPVGVDWVVLGFCFAVSVAVGVVFGLAPAFQASKVNLIEALKTRTGASGGAGRAWMRDALVASEIALSLALLAGAGLLLRTFANMRSVELGVRRDHVLTGALIASGKKYESMDGGMALVRQLEEKLKSAPGILDAALNSMPPLDAGSNGYITVDGAPPVDGYSGPLVVGNQITPDYFHVMGIKLLEGRGLSEEDEQIAAAAWSKVAPLIEAHKIDEAQKEAAKVTGVAVISKEMAQEFWPGQDPVGKGFHQDTLGFTVVGVVADTRNRGARELPMAAAYVPIGYTFGYGGFYLSISALTAVKPEAAENAIREAVRSADSTIALAQVKTIPAIVSEGMADTNDEALLLSVLAGLAVLLAAVGTYGVMSYVVSQRTNEIGIRMALGAQRENVMNMVMGQGGALIGVGVVGGLVLAAVGARLMKDLLFGVASFDVATYGGVAVMLALVGALACAVPAGRAMRVSPMEALREE
jgi:putative ABC transport system permease protein